MRVARRFNAGIDIVVRHVPEGRLNWRSFQRFHRPFGLDRIAGLNPALKRWAIFVCPSGTAAVRTRSDFPKRR